VNDITTQQVEMGKLWQVVHVTETLTHALTEFPPANTIMHSACVCKVVKFAQCANMQLFQTWQNS
jgi:hypothetical protein